MYRLVTFAVLVLMLGSVARATTTTYITTDGVWWTSLTDDQKVVAMFAETDGYTSGWNDGTFLEGLHGVDRSDAYQRRFPKAPSYEKFAETYANAHKADTSFKPSFAYHAISHFISKIDAFYLKYPNRQSVLVGTLLTCIADNTKVDCSVVGQP